MSSEDDAPDLTAILVPAAQHDAGSVRRLVLAGGYGDGWLRARALPAVGLLQVELFDGRGLPRLDANLVLALSRGGSAAFVHRNREAGQALLHHFEGGRENNGLWHGAPDELDGKLVAALGHGLRAIVAADDGSRVHPAYAASSTTGLCRGRPLAVPLAAPLGLGSFGFHDRNAVAPGRPAVAVERTDGKRADGERTDGEGTNAERTNGERTDGEGTNAERTNGERTDGEGTNAERTNGERTDGEGTEAAEDDRVALVAYDAEAMRSAWQTVTGAELAARLRELPDHVVGPLLAARDEAAADLAALGDETPEAAGLTSVRAMELLALSETFVFGGGESVRYLDQRLLPLFSLASHEPALDDPEEAEALERRESVLAAMVEVLPYRSPEGSVLESLEDAEVRPLAPWARPGGEYRGAVFPLHGGRVRALLSSFDQRDLATWVDRFYRGWWKAQTDDPWGPAFDAWRRKLDERGGPDVDRLLRDWAEWRLVLDMAHANQLVPALVFYG